MNKTFASNPFNDHSDELFGHIRQTLDFLKGKLKGTILDVGQPSPLTEAIIMNFPVQVTNTVGDLDEEFTVDHIGYWPFNFIIYSHTIEHQFNPLNTLLGLKYRMNDNTVMFIMLPSRGKLLWTKGHFHEIDHYRMQALLDRAGLKIVAYERRKHWRRWYSYLTGIRPLLRLLFEYNAYYTVKK